MDVDRMTGEKYISINTHNTYYGVHKKEHHNPQGPRGTDREEVHQPFKIRAEETGRVEVGAV